MYDSISKVPRTCLCLLTAGERTQARAANAAEAYTERVCEMTRPHVYGHVED